MCKEFSDALHPQQSFSDHNRPFAVMDGVDAAIAALEVYEYESGGERVSWFREHVDTMSFAQTIEELKDQ